MRDVNSGWLLRYAHANGASMFFIVVYLHIFRGLYYGSYKAPREMVWLLGVVIFLLMMATAFMGYVLPWGQMSFWGAQVITGFFSAIPVVGDPIRTWLLGGFAPDNAALNRFFSLHYLLPFVIAGVVILHIWALHIPGSNNPTGVDVKGPQDTVPFHPYYTAKDGFGVGVFLILFALLVFFAPNLLGHPDNYIPANPLSTPAHIVPEWYFLPFYAILKAFTFNFLWIPAKLWGVMAMFGSILLLFFLPWIDTLAGALVQLPADVPWFFWVLVVDVVVLGYLGQAEPSMWVVLGSQICAAYYFAHFLIILPIVSRIERPLPLPNSITESVLHGESRRGRADRLADRLSQGKTDHAPLLRPAHRSARRASASSPRCCSRSSSRRARRSRKPPRTRFHREPKELQLASDGPLGKFDRQQLQRGFQVYKEVCSACHSLHLVAFRDLRRSASPRPR